MTSFAGPICAFMASLTWAVGSSAYARMALTHTPFAINFARALVALPFFLIFSVALADFGNPFTGVELRHWGWFLLSMTASYGLGDLCFILSTRSLGVPGALAIASSYPVITALGESFASAAPLGFRQVAGLGLTFFGVVGVILNAPKPIVVPEAPSVAPEQLSDPELGPVKARPSRLARRSTGVALALCTAVLWSINTWAVGRGGADLPAVVANMLRMILALGIIFTLGRALAPRRPLLLPAVQIRSALPVFLFEAVGGSFFFTYGLAHSPLVIGATLTSLAPVIAVPVAWALGLERLSLPRSAAVITAVTGLWLLVIP